MSKRLPPEVEEVGNLLKDFWRVIHRLAAITPDWVNKPGGKRFQEARVWRVSRDTAFLAAVRLDELALFLSHKRGVEYELVRDKELWDYVSARICDDGWESVDCLELGRRCLLEHGDFNEDHHDDTEMGDDFSEEPSDDSLWSSPRTNMEWRIWIAEQHPLYFKRNKPVKLTTFNTWLRRGTLRRHPYDPYGKSQQFRLELRGLRRMIANYRDEAERSE